MDDGAESQECFLPVFLAHVVAETFCFVAFISCFFYYYGCLQSCLLPNQSIGQLSLLKLAVDLL